MSRKEDYEKNKQYIIDEGLDCLIDFEENINFEETAFDSVHNKMKIPYPPESNDLIRLHKLIRQRKSFTICEFGLGYSTLIMADALLKNKLEYENIKNKPDIRNSNMFKLFCVDPNKKWIKHCKAILPKNLKDIVVFHYSPVSVDKFNGQLCHTFDNLPNIIPDFIYLDGPNIADVKGSINGLSFDTCYERTVMSADLLLMESTFLPGLIIVIDGRTNNARFLQNNFKRKYKIQHMVESDVTIVELDEKRLGKRNILGSDFMGNNK